MDRRRTTRQTSGLGIAMRWDRPLAEHPDISVTARITGEGDTRSFELRIENRSSAEVVLWEWGLIYTSGYVEMMGTWAMDQRIPPGGAYAESMLLWKLTVWLIKAHARGVIGAMVDVEPIKEDLYIPIPGWDPMPSIAAEPD